MHPLRPFQRQFLRGALKPGISEAALSIPRGNGKSWLAGYLISRILDPQDKLFRKGTESVLLASSLDQARIAFRFARPELEGKGGHYRFSDSTQKVEATHVPTLTRLKVISSRAKSAFGLVNCPFAIADEPGAWENVGGQLMQDALVTSLGKPGSPLRIVYIGTLAPSTGGWWHDLIGEGSGPGRFVQALQGDPEKWDRWPEIRRCNPLCNISAPFRAQLLQERDRARVDSRLKARFLSYRLNVPSADESKVLLTVEDWKEALARPIRPRVGKPIIGIDLGGGRAWSAAVGVWQNGRAEALAITPGIPSLEKQEQRDRVPRGTYCKLKNLRIAEGKRVPPVGLLVREIYERWGRPARLICDRFRLAELQDEVGPAGPYIEPRRQRWSEAGEDIRAVRKMTKDGPLSVEKDSRPLIAASLSAAKVKNDEQGSFRLVKKDPANNTARDDVAVAFLLAAGGWDRAVRRGASGTIIESSIIG